MELKGKKINFIGDSITEGHRVENPENIYPNILKRSLGLAEARNYGVGGSRIARIHNPQGYPSDEDFNMRAERMDSDFDVVVVFGGTNDFGHGNIPLGKMGDSDVYTFYGALKTLCLYLINNYPDKQIVFMTPLHRLNEELDYNKRLEEKNPNARPLCDFVNAIREVCELYSIPVLDMFRESGMPARVWAWCENHMPDGLHPNDNGQKIIAHKLQKFLENL
ncbi:MAG: SGNH/GDSL hydrolase family protein [Ruminococcaceae bacterium]|nr:SGNH/GDSL hydrolase family protein [Oscillospiraceae bacterium]